MILQKFWSDHYQDLDKIIKGSCQDLSKILKISFQYHWKILSRSYQDPAASCRILSKILHDLTKGLAKIISKILPWFHQDLVKILPRFSTWVANVLFLASFLTYFLKQLSLKWSMLRCLLYFLSYSFLVSQDMSSQTNPTWSIHVWSSSTRWGSKTLTVIDQRKQKKKRKQF